MSTGETQLDARIAEWWDWFAVALFLLVTVDMLTTMGATVRYGFAAEANPLMAFLIQQGPGALLLVNLAAVVVAVLSFRSVVAAVQASPPPWDRYLTIGVEVWLGLLLAAGLVIFANNLSVIVLGGSLI